MSHIGLFFLIALAMVFASGINAQPQCGVNEVLDECPDNCPPDPTRPPRACIQICRPACVCRPGYVRIVNRFGNRVCEVQRPEERPISPDN
ncbi:venom serine protease inhibitor [Diachasma alloeum]|uniref:venom serine protease inhibitor n=1 Tax=Diachasma alloeum TaxID=454923 RepID=UPI0007382BD9|nr:venom serine protease inhibitor [Diachasma alloeum]